MSTVDVTLCVYVLGEWIHGGKRVESFPVFHNGLLLNQICLPNMQQAKPLRSAAEKEFIHKGAK